MSRPSCARDGGGPGVDNRIASAKTLVGRYRCACTFTTNSYRTLKSNESSLAITPQNSSGKIPSLPPPMNSIFIPICRGNKIDSMRVAPVCPILTNLASGIKIKKVRSYGLISQHIDKVGNLATVITIVVHHHHNGSFKFHYGESLVAVAEI